MSHPQDNLKNISFNKESSVTTFITSSKTENKTVSDRESSTNKTVSDRESSANKTVSDRESSTNKTVSDREYSIGIDLGTTYSVVCYFNEAKQLVEVIENECGNRITASFVSFTDQECIVGD